jgi:G:T-mismatch repair DNA endonuclease (very short patch repair protein)
MTKRELYYIGSLLKEVERSDDKIEALESLYFEIRTLHKCECKRRGLTQKEERK